MPTPAPVFVYGSVRSGTTMFRLMLNSHPQIDNPGEVDVLFDFLSPPSAAAPLGRYDREGLAAHRIFRAHGLALRTDCDGTDLLADLLAQFEARARARHPATVLTANIHRHPDRIRALLPGARFIHLLRDPRDVARSSIGMGWAGNSYYGLAPWIEAERAWDRVAPHLAPDQVLELRFERLMADLEPELTRVCDFLGRPFRPEMLDYHRATSYGPPDPRMAGQWRRTAGAREIALIEGQCGALMAARGYAPAGAPAIPGPVEALRLAAGNRLGRWRFNIRRFGLGLFLAAHASRILRLRGLESRLRRRMDARIVAGLK
jgi:hypothetical protein